MSQPKPSWYLREWRTYLGFTQERLAGEAGMHKADVSRLERFDLRWNETHLAKFAAALRIERWWLIEVNPFDPGSDLALLDAIRRVPVAKRADVTRMVGAVAEPAQDNFRLDVPPAAVPVRRGKK